MPRGALGSRFFPASFQVLCVCVADYTQGIDPWLSAIACHSLGCHGGIEFQVTSALVWVCDFRAVYVLELLFYFGLGLVDLNSFLFNFSF